jgi:hypothetical protein
MESAFAKLDRAKEHIAQYLSLANEFRGSDPYTVREKKDATGAKKPYTFVKPVPHRVICAAGDAIHNLRSSLDHVASALALRANFSEDRLRDVHFTIRKRRKDFNRAVAERIVSDIHPRWPDFLRRIEPYQGGHGSDLQRVSALDNVDKHRDLLGVALFFRAIHIEPGGIMRHEHIPLEEGVPGSFAIWSGDPKAAMVFGFDITLADAGPGQEAEAIIELRRLAETVEDVLRKAAAEFF